MTTEIVKHGGVIVEFSPAEITADFDAMRAELERRLAPYEGMTGEGAANMDIKQAKQCRAELREWSRDLNDARKAIKRVYTAPLAEFEAKVKELDGLIQAPVEILDGAIKKREQAEREEREKALRAHYEAFAGDFAQVVPLEKFLVPQWLNKTGWTYDGEEYYSARVFSELESAVAKAAGDWETLQRMAGKLHDFEDARLYFFDVLDLGQTIEHDEERHRAALEVEKIQREQVREEPEKEPQAADDAPVDTFVSSSDWKEWDKYLKEWLIRFSATDAQFARLKGAMDAFGITDRHILREARHE